MEGYYLLCPKLCQSEFSIRITMVSCTKFFSLIVVLLATLLSHSASAELTDPVWSRATPEATKIIRFHFFWSKTCPHCQKAKPFINELARSYDWLELNSYEISENQKNAVLYRTFLEKVGGKNLAVPAFLFCEQIVVGYLNDETTGAQLRNMLLNCRASLAQERKEFPHKAVETTKFSLPLLGDLDSESLSLPVFTIVIASLDAFNPCAFFVLLLMLSLLVNAKDRKRMLLIGGIFVFFSGFIYFLFMAAWLNLFLYLGEIRSITLVAALIAIGVSIINIKDYFLFKKGVSLSIPDSAKPNLYGRIRGLINAPSMTTMILGTIMLAIVANSYELLCTSGFPMVFTRLLTLHNLTSSSYYLYLVLYNVIYVIPLTVIVLIFTKTLGTRKLSEKEGRILKLVSGLMMLELGLVLLFAPNLLNHLLTAIGLIVMAIIISGTLILFNKKI
jgi:thiol-disulfide isomerase/thioredoxin